MSDMTSCENALLVILKFSARPWNSLRSSFVWAGKFKFTFVQNPVKANFAFGWVTISLDLNSWISFKMLRNKCAKFVFRAQWLVTVSSSWQVVGGSSLVQCKTRFVQIFHIFFFVEHIVVDPPPVVLKVTVSDPHHICTCRPYPLSIGRYQQMLRLYGWLDFVCRLKT